MTRLGSLLLATVLGCGSALAQDRVELRGISAEIKLDEVLFGHLPEVNGKFRLRATEVTFAPDGYLGVHHHVGPGIRYVLSGEVTFTEGGNSTIYKRANISLKPETWRTPRRTRPRSRFVSCSSSFSRRTGRARRLLFPSLEGPSASARGVPAKQKGRSEERPLK